ncbi:hypothetical protein OEZ86_006251 [Tetradesmus obliquus]|nr:hypothetical protein OEZ86_006251 [Tetradesmus obliquus]
MGKLGDILAHPEELLPLIRIYAATKKATQLPEDPKLAFCYDMLNRVSRSFAIVIQQLPNPLRDAICVFYLLLRALDTVEDDMAIDNKVKIPALLAFHESIYDRGFTMQCGYGHYVRLMEHLGTVIDVFLGLEPHFQEVIADITQRMGEGMAEFIQRDVETIADYDLYCHYVAGLVGVGLSQLFASSGLESASYARAEVLSNHMGLFLQKTNIIRDYLEDINEEPAPRMFWPHEIWGQYGDSLEDFKQPGNRRQAVQCLNHLVCNALQHLPHCIKYMQGLRDRDVFRFCAIPQIMAIGTLALCYNNGAIFEGVVKLRRGMTARVFDECDGMGELYGWFTQFLQALQEKALLAVDKADPTREILLDLVSSNLQHCESELTRIKSEQPRKLPTQQRLMDASLLLLTGAWFYRAWELGSSSGSSGSSMAGVWGLLDGAGGVLPAGYDGLEKALVLMLLLAAVSRMVLVRLG